MQTPENLLDGLLGRMTTTENISIADREIRRSYRKLIRALKNEPQTDRVARGVPRSIFVICENGELLIEAK